MENGFEKIKKSREMQITINYLQGRIDQMVEELEKINARLKKDNDNNSEAVKSFSKIQERRMESLAVEIDIYRHIVSVTETELAIQKIQEAEEDLSAETEWEREQEMHSEVTLEMELGREIPLAEWARNNNINPDNARQKALRGTLKTAHKVGNVWLINENERVEKIPRKSSIYF